VIAVVQRATRGSTFAIVAKVREVGSDAKATVSPARLWFVIVGVDLGDVAVVDFNAVVLVCNFLTTVAPPRSEKCLGAFTMVNVIKPSANKVPIMIKVKNRMMTKIAVNVHGQFIKKKPNNNNKSI